MVCFRVKGFFFKSKSQDKPRKILCNNKFKIYSLSLSGKYLGQRMEIKFLKKNNNNPIKLVNFAALLAQVPA
jgi:hypothetical protein